MNLFKPRFLTYRDHVPLFSNQYSVAILSVHKLISLKVFSVRLSLTCATGFARVCAAIKWSLGIVKFYGAILDFATRRFCLTPPFLLKHAMHMAAQTATLLASAKPCK